MQGMNYSEMLLWWKILLFLLEEVLADPEEVKPQTSNVSTTERSVESCRK